MKENEKGQRTKEKRKHVGVERWWVAETSAGEDEECNSEKNGDRKTPREEKKERKQVGNLGTARRKKGRERRLARFSLAAWGYRESGKSERKG
ncbi:unnamed protein product [Citrullus colocynthis]|uniref:Uncharacterized protein n=1 Tax=Citrullus colocynthis TaxID=252529 RepID=A0ABP0YT13_9ROSI